MVKSSKLLFPFSKRQGGFALVLVLAITVMLTGIATLMTQEAYQELNQVIRRKERLQYENKKEGILNDVYGELVYPPLKENAPPPEPQISYLNPDSPRSGLSSAYNEYRFKTDADPLKLEDNTTVPAGSDPIDMVARGLDEGKETVTGVTYFLGFGSIFSKEKEVAGEKELQYEVFPDKGVTVAVYMSPCKSISAGPYIRVVQDPITSKDKVEFNLCETPAENLAGIDNPNPPDFWFVLMDPFEYCLFSYDFFDTARDSGLGLDFFKIYNKCLFNANKGVIVAPCTDVENCNEPDDNIDLYAGDFDSPGPEGQGSEISTALQTDAPGTYDDEYIRIPQELPLPSVCKDPKDLDEDDDRECYINYRERMLCIDNPDNIAGFYQTDVNEGIAGCELGDSYAASGKAEQMAGGGGEAAGWPQRSLGDDDAFDAVAAAPKVLCDFDDNADEGVCDRAAGLGRDEHTIPNQTQLNTINTGARLADGSGLYLIPASGQLEIRDTDDSDDDFFYHLHGPDVEAPENYVTLNDIVVDGNLISGATLPHYDFDGDGGTDDYDEIMDNEFLTICWWEICLWDYCTNIPYPCFALDCECKGTCNDGCCSCCVAANDGCGNINCEEDGSWSLCPSGLTNPLDDGAFNGHEWGGDWIEELWEIAMKIADELIASGLAIWDAIIDYLVDWAWSCGNCLLIGAGCGTDNCFCVDYWVIDIGFEVDLGAAVCWVLGLSCPDTCSCAPPTIIDGTFPESTDAIQNILDVLAAIFDFVGWDAIHDLASANIEFILDMAFAQLGGTIIDGTVVINGDAIFVNRFNMLPGSKLYVLGDMKIKDYNPWNRNVVRIYGNPQPDAVTGREPIFHKDHTTLYVRGDLYIESSSGSLFEGVRVDAGNEGVFCNATLDANCEGGLLVVENGVEVYVNGGGDNANHWFHDVPADATDGWISAVPLFGRSIAEEINAKITEAQGLTAHHLHPADATDATEWHDGELQDDKHIHWHYYDEGLLDTDCDEPTKTASYDYYQSDPALQDNNEEYHYPYAWEWNGHADLEIENDGPILCIDEPRKMFINYGTMYSNGSLAVSNNLIGQGALIAQTDMFLLGVAYQGKVDLQAWPVETIDTQDHTPGDDPCNTPLITKTCPYDPNASYHLLAGRDIFLWDSLGAEALCDYENVFNGIVYTGGKIVVGVRSGGLNDRSLILEGNLWANHIGLAAQNTWDWFDWPVKVRVDPHGKPNYAVDIDELGFPKSQLMIPVNMELYHW